MVIGHHFQLNYLKKLAESGKIPHALLFSGEDEIGKKKIAFEFASILLKCDVEKIESGNHPDFLFIEPVSQKGRENKIQKPEIKISKIREMVSFFNLGTFSSPFKIAVIDDTHLMRRDAQSSFLKLLEEPKGNALFILLTSLPKTLLSTIRSRAQEIKFYRVPDKEIADWLKKKNIPEKEINDIVDLSRGKPGRAHNFISEPGKIREEKMKIKEILKLVKSDLKTKFEYAETASKNPRELKEILEFWTEYFRQALLKKARGKSSGKYTLEETEKILKLIQNLKKIISTTNVNPRLALEILMIEL
jgi:DNA polymerase III subunit delta'